MGASFERWVYREFILGVVRGGLEEGVQLFSPRLLTRWSRAIHGSRQIDSRLALQLQCSPEPSHPVFAAAR